MQGEMPGSLAAGKRAGWTFMESVMPEISGGKRTSLNRLSGANLRGANELGISTYRLTALEGHTYLFRSALHETKDHMVIFTVVERDEFGLTLAWRSLREWLME